MHSRGFLSFDVSVLGGRGDSSSTEQETAHGSDEGSTRRAASVEVLNEPVLESGFILVILTAFWEEEKSDKCL